MKTILLNIFRKSYSTVAKILFVSILLLLFSGIGEGENATPQKSSPTIPCVVFDDSLYLRGMGEAISNNLDVALEMARKDAALSLSRKLGSYFVSGMVGSRIEYSLHVFDSFDDNDLESICVEVTKNEEDSYVVFMAVQLSKDKISRLDDTDEHLKSLINQKVDELHQLLNNRRAR